MGNLHLTALRLESTTVRTEEFIKQVAPNIAHRTIVEKITDIAMAKKIPPRYWQSIHAEMEGMALIIWVDFEGENKEPLGHWFEEGTKKHKIMPIKAKVLSWIQNGIRRFSLGHWVRGIRARHAFRDGVRAGLPLFLEALRIEIQAYQDEAKIFG